VATEVAGGATRDSILRAAERIIQEKGLAAATTRAIATEARCAEGSIYRYFPDKHALFTEVVKQQAPDFLLLLHELKDRAGTRTVQRNLEEVTEAAMRFHRAVIPMVCGSMAEHKLLHEQRRYYRESQRGPLKAFNHLDEYLEVEQRLGRIPAAASPRHLSRVLLGTCFAQAFLLELVGEDARLGTDAEFARELVRTVLEGFAPTGRKKRATASA
jgi:AcrR family transcriptional regulator